MYPWIRLILTAAREARRPEIGLLDTCTLPLRCWPIDLDLFAEMNNGRILTLYDFGRNSLAIRTGLARVAQKNGWGFVVAGSSVRYRSRLTAFQKFELRSRVVGWDERFVYMEQAMWRGDTCCNHALLRTGVTEGGRLIQTQRVLDALQGQEETVSPPLPAWVAAWTEADTERPWPPAI